MNYLLVAAFGAAGAVSRFAIDSWVGGMHDARFPWGTFAVNIAGSFLLGVVVAQTTERIGVDPQWRIALGVGFLGAFTTFSTYTYETIKLAEDGVLGLAFAYALASLALGLLAAGAGLILGRAL